MGKGLRGGQCRKKSSKTAVENLSCSPQELGEEGRPRLSYWQPEMVMQKPPDPRGRRTIEFGTGPPGRKPCEISLCTRVGGQLCRVWEGVKRLQRSEPG